MRSLDFKPINRKVIWFYLVLAAVVLGINTAFLNLNFSFDAMTYALQLEDDYSSRFLHPHHLLFQTVAWVWYRLGKFLVSWSAMEAVQWLNAIAGTVGILLVFQIISNRVGNVTVAALLSLGAAFSYSYWFYSIEFETYILPLTLVLSAIFVLIRYATTFVSVAWVAMAVGLATLLHQTHILMTIAVVTYLLSTADSGRRIHYVLFFLTLSGLLIVIPYLFAAYITGNLTDLASLFSWITDHAQSGKGGIISWLNVPYAIAGFTWAFFSLEHFRDALITEHFSMISGVMLLLMGLCLGSMVVILARSRKWWLAKVATEVRLLKLCTVMGVVYTGFVMYWKPQNPELLVPIVPTVTIIFGLLMHWDRINIGFLLCLVITMFATNFVGSIYPNSQLQNNTNYLLAKKLKEHNLGKEDLVLVARMFPKKYLRLFFGTSVINRSLTNASNANAATLDATKDIIEQTIEAGNRVLISENELKPDKIFALGRLAPDQISDFYKTLDYSLRLLFRFQVSGQEKRMYEFVTGAPGIPK